MKQLRLLILAVAATALCSATVYACGNDKTSATAASTGNAKASAACATGKKANATAAAMNGCSAQMASQCTPEMAAACAQAKKSGKMAANACPMSGGSCSMHGKTSATAAAAMSDCCAGKGKTSATAAAMGSCGTGKARTTAMAAGSSCSAHGAGATMAAHSCDACADMAQADAELEAAGARAQVVPLKNGVMYVYTADSPDHIRAVQAAVTRSNERAKAVLAAGDRAKLCPGCKRVRGEMASGKMHREVVNVETGAMTLVTSTDRSIVNRLHASAGTEVAERQTSH